MRSILDPICLEVMDNSMVDLLDDPGVMDSEDLSWMDVAVPREGILSISRVKNVDSNMDERGSERNDDS